MIMINNFSDYIMLYLVVTLLAFASTATSTATSNRLEWYYFWDFFEVTSQGKLNV